MLQQEQIPVSPVTKPRMTNRDRWGTNKRPIVERYHTFRDEIRLVYKKPLPAKLMVVFNVPMPKSWSDKRKQEMFGKPNQQRPDIDNYIKALLDALCEDDSYIYDIRAIKKWSILGSIELYTEDGYNM